MIALFLLVQAAPAPTSLPDIQLRVRATAKSVRIEQRGTTSLKIYATPDAGSIVDVKAPPVDGSARNVTVAVDAEGRIGDPTQVPAQTPQ